MEFRAQGRPDRRGLLSVAHCGARSRKPPLALPGMRPPHEKLILCSLGNVVPSKLLPGDGLVAGRAGPGWKLASRAWPWFPLHAPWCPPLREVLRGTCAITCA